MIDNNCFIYRAFYAIRNLQTSTGFPTNAIYGFTMMLMKLISQEKPEYIAVASDFPAPTFRHRVFPEYKSTRPEMPEELAKQFPVIKEIISLLRIPIFEVEGYEADDILGTISKQAAEYELMVYILTRDKDCLQLVTPHTRIMRENNTVSVYDAEKVISRFGVKPEKLVDVWALSGDVSDNIPGVPGIGEKTAVRLIQEFGSLENTLANIQRVGNVKVKENLRKFSHLAKLSKELVTINCSVPVSCDLEACRMEEPDREKLREVFKELEFKKLLEML